jgi:ribosomal protein S18 acetylase RimI-like enzyme
MHLIRRIRPADGLGLRTVRLQALLSDPGAFGSSYGREAELSDEEWVRRAAESSHGTRQCLFVADGDGGFVGVAGAYTPDNQPSVRHLYGMWVAPGARSAGIGRQLVDAITRWSIEAGAAEVQLSVVEDNLAARKLYTGAGFEGSDIMQPLPSDPALTETLLRLHLGPTRP